jgi:hypothetical protein
MTTWRVGLVCIRRLLHGRARSRGSDGSTALTRDAGHSGSSVRVGKFFTLGLQSSSPGLGVFRHVGDSAATHFLLPQVGAACVWF